MNWSLLLAALISVESGGDTRAINPRDGAVGCLQVRKGCIRDVNRHSGTKYELKDLYGNERLSRLVCERYLRIHAASDYESAARLWNSGPDWRNKKYKTDRYWRRVERKIQELKAKNAYSGLRRWSVGQRVSALAER